MQAVTALERLGGIADTRSLLALTTRQKIRTALRRREILRLARGRYVLPTAAEGHLKAAELSGVVALRSAAAHYGWELKLQPPVPEITVRTNRNLATDRRKGVRIFGADLGPEDVVDGVTSPLRTVVDCARRLPFDEALAIADSALRSGTVTADELRSAEVRGAGADAVRRVLQHADGRAANAFESVTRALCIEVELAVEPQLPLDLGTGTIHPDLVNVEMRLVIEADSWTFHTTRKAFGQDCSRYNLLVIRGWRVLRFTWEQVMHDPGLRPLGAGPTGAAFRTG